MSTAQYDMTNDKADSPSSMLEIYMEALNGDTGDPFLDEVNLGTGNYTSAEYWLQVEEFRKGLYAESAMVREIMERARQEAKRALAEEVVNGTADDLTRGVDHPSPGDLGVDEYLSEYGDDLWESLGAGDWTRSQHQAWVVHEVTGISEDWVPPHWRMLKMRHEASQSKGARALDNVFSRVKEFVGDTPEEFE